MGSLQLKGVKPRGSRPFTGLTRGIADDLKGILLSSAQPPAFAKAQARQANSRECTQSRTERTTTDSTDDTDVLNHIKNHQNESYQ